MERKEEMKKSKTAIIMVVVTVLIWVAYKIYEFANEIDESCVDSSYYSRAFDSDAYWEQGKDK
jgi:heme/copper-type cytochrome/quinol oxidase subunit 3